MSYAQSSSTDIRSGTAGRTTVQKAALAVGIVFLAFGLLGFIPGITSNYSSMAFASHMSEAKLLGLFQVSILHNIVHLLFGVAGLALAKTAAGARNFLVVGQNSAANFVPVNTADDILHLLLGVGMLGLGLALTRRRTTPAV